MVMQKKVNKRKLLNLIIFLVVIFTIFIYFLNATHNYNLEYTINDVKVNENNTFDITETITANFYMRKHGIIRTIPLKNTIERLDGSTSTNRVKITNLQVNNEYSKSNSNGNLAIKIGNQDTYVTGLQKYIIKYTYDIGADPVKDADEFYYNLIGTEWDTSISNISFSITMPKEFDASSFPSKKPRVYSDPHQILVRLCYQRDGYHYSNRRKDKIRCNYGTNRKVTHKTHKRQLSPQKRHQTTLLLFLNFLFS